MIQKSPHKLQKLQNSIKTLCLCPLSLIIFSLLHKKLILLTISITISFINALHISSQRCFNVCFHQKLPFKYITGQMCLHFPVSLNQDTAQGYTAVSASEIFVGHSKTIFSKHSVAVRGSMHQIHVYAVTQKVTPLESPQQGVVHGNNTMTFIYQEQCKTQTLY